MFGRLYTAGVILPKDNFDHLKKMKDSKKIKNKKVMKDLSNYIKENSIAWNISYIEADEIDNINIRQAVLKSMTNSIKEVIKQLDDKEGVFLVIDGNDYIGYIDEETEKEIQHVCVEKGDNTYSFIAAASILAKCEHSEYIEKLCEENPLLQERYGIRDNVGYGTKKHLEGIKNNGITQWHRKTYGCCKEAKYNPI